MVNLRTLEKSFFLLMNMHCTKWVIVFTILFISYGSSHAQSQFIGLGESALSVNHKVSPFYTIHFALETRCFLYQDEVILLKQQQLDFAHFSTFNLNYNYSLSLGVEYRHRDAFETGHDELRITEQFNYKIKTLGKRYGHRFRSEQRLLKDKTIFRNRYRFAIDFPLNGEKLDIGEAYLVNSTEGLLSLSETAKPECDFRISSQIGWKINNKLKFQTGLEYRFEAFNLQTEHRLFVLTSAVFKI